MGAYRGNLIDENKNEIKLLNSLNFNSHYNIFHFDQASIEPWTFENGFANGLRLDFTITPDSYMEKSDINYIFSSSTNDNTFQINLATDTPLYFIDPYFKTNENSENYFNLHLMWEATLYNGIGDINANRIPQAKTSLNSFGLTIRNSYINPSNFSPLYDMKGNLGATLSENFTIRINCFSILVNRNGKI